MEIVLNDMTFLHKFNNIYSLNEAINTLVEILIELENNRKSFQIVFNKNLYTMELMKDYSFSHLLGSKDIRKDTKRVVMSFISKVKLVNSDNCDRIVFDEGEESGLIGYAVDNKMVVLSLVSDAKFDSPILIGKNQVTKENVTVKNIGSKLHIYIHQDFLNIRIYEMNPKHKIGHNWGSPMDLKDEVAQRVLDGAIVYKDDNKCLINYYNGKYYVFRRHIDSCYHGYVDEHVPENIKRKFSGHQDEI